MEKILISQHDHIIESEIRDYQGRFANGKQIISMLAALGLNVKKVDDWKEIEEAFKKEYPKASLEFNLQATGIEKEFIAVQELYRRTWQCLEFEPMTTQQKEVICEQNRIYAETPAQIEAYNLITQIIDNFNKLLSLGVKINVNNAYDVNPVFSLKDNRLGAEMGINQKNLTSLITSLK